MENEQNLNNETMSDRDRQMMDISSENVQTEDTDFDKELDGETLSKVMDKIRDINELGTAFSSVGAYGRGRVVKLQIIQAVLDHGLLGIASRTRATVGDNPFAKSDEEVTTKWARDVREERDARVFFNIIGRYTRDDVKTRPQFIKPLSDYEFIRGDRERCIVLFDLSPFSYDSEGKRYNDPNAEQTNRKYHTSQGGGEVGRLGPQAPDDTGFNLSYRVPPRMFKGIVYKVAPGEVESSSQATLDNKERAIGAEEKPTISSLLKQIYDISPDKETVIGPKARDYLNRSSLIFHMIAASDAETSKLSQNEPAMELRAQELANIMKNTYKDNPELLVPIYDTAGNMRWPMKKSYREVIIAYLERELLQKNEGRQL